LPFELVGRAKYVVTEDISICYWKMIGREQEVTGLTVSDLFDDSFWRPFMLNSFSAALSGW